MIVLFGLAGAGKNYIGERLAEAGLGYFWDADTRLTPDMHEAIAAQKIFTPSMRAHYFQDIITFIKTNFQAIPRLIIAQAFYQNQYRLTFNQHFPNTQWVQISATQTTRHQRLQQRQHSVDASYAKKIELFFETPSHDYQIFHNEQDASSKEHQDALQILIKQLSS